MKIGRFACVVAIACFIAPFTSLGQGPVLVTTFTNPIPSSPGRFSISMAAVGNDHVLIGADLDNEGSLGPVGEVFLFSTNGALVTTFTNPAPIGSPSSSSYGAAVAAMENDRVVISAIFSATSETVYLYNTNGTLLRTYTNPAPEVFGSSFGVSLATLGNSIAIGSPYSDIGTTNAGVVYLYNTNGTLIKIITNPAPSVEANFGNAIAVIGNDRILVGGSGATNGTGIAYLMNTNGAKLATFTNPMPDPADAFGFSVAVVGTDRVLIGAIGDDTGASAAGVAYLFATNGTLITTYTNPFPSGINFFGNSVAAAGTARVLIGAPMEQSGIVKFGGTFLYSTNGTLLGLFDDPGAADGDRFGNTVAALGPDKLLIGAFGNDTGATDSGAAYLFGIVPPTLNIRRTTTNTAIVFWPPFPTFSLQQNTNLSTTNWVASPDTVNSDGTNNFIVVNPPLSNRFYRLFSP